MAADLVEAVENEISCPICFEDFEEPKCLPNCAHNVCQHCLEGMVKKTKNAIECPVCRVESVIPNDGIAAFPKNHLLVRLIERTPGRKEKQSMKQALKNCKTKVEGAKAGLKEVEYRFYATAKSQAEKMKEKIKSMAENVVSMVREQERRMLGELDQKFGQILNVGTFATHKFNTMKLCENASSCMQTVEDILQSGNMSDLKDLSEALVKELNVFSESLDTMMANSEFTQLFDVSLIDTGSVEKFIEDECSLGKLNINTGQATQIATRLVEYSKFGSVIQTIDRSTCGIAKFTPFSVAVARDTGHFAVLDLDEESNRVHIFNNAGEPLNTFCITSGDPWDIAVLNDNEVVVLDRASNRFLHYNMNGNFKFVKKPVPAPKKNVKFSSLSIDNHERFVISSCPCVEETKDDTLSCILVYSPLGKRISSIGEGVLSSPEKAVFFNGKFFVADSVLQSVIVFDKDGFLKEIGKSQLQNPSSIAADYSNGQLFISDSSNSTIQIYSQAGDLLLRFQTDYAPVGVAFTKHYKNLLICC